MNILKHIFYNKPSGIFDGIVEYGILQEGLIASYDINMLISRLKKILGDRVTVISNNPVFTWKSYTIQIDIVDYTKQDSDKVLKILDVFGYYISKEKKLGEFSTLTIEPKFPIKINNLMIQNDIKYLYHITAKKDLPAIQKTGLAPRGTETTFYHPNDRIYLMYAKNLFYIKKFKDILASDKRFASDDMIVVRTPFNNNYDYYLDDTATIMERNIYVCFVLKNIPPNAIEITNI